MAIIAASSRPRRSSSATSLEFCPISSTRTPGWRASTSATSPAPAYSRAVPNIPNRMVPVSNDFTCLGRPPGVLGRGQGVLGVRAQGVGDRGRYDATADPAEQLDAERLLQRPDLLGDRRLGVAELLGRPGQRPVLVDAEEAGQLVQGKHRTLLGQSLESQATPIATGRSHLECQSDPHPASDLKEAPHVRPPLHRVRQAPADLPEPGHLAREHRPRHHRGVQLLVRRRRRPCSPAAPSRSPSPPECTRRLAPGSCASTTRRTASEGTRPVLVSGPAAPYTSAGCPPGSAPP